MTTAMGTTTRSCQETGGLHGGQQWKWGNSEAKWKIEIYQQTAM